MAKDSVDNISTHQSDADGRLPAQYAEAPGAYPNKWGVGDISGWTGTIYSLVGPAQVLEDILEEVLTERSLALAEGKNLDRIGQIVGQDRGGESDTRYRQLIVGKIAENNSDGTARDLLTIVGIILGDLLTGSLGIQEYFPAKAQVEYGLDEGETGVDPQLVQDSMEKAKAAGVEVSTLRYVTGDYFGFDSDAGAGGFGSLGLPSESTYGSGNTNDEIFSATRQYYQTFVASGTELVSVTMNSFYNRFGTATGNLKLSLFSENGAGEPDTLIADSSNVIDVSTLDTTFGGPSDNTPVTFNFSSPAMVVSTTYCLVVSVVGYGGANLGFCFRNDNPYADGLAGSSSDGGATWNTNITGITTADIQMDIVQSSTPELFYGSYYSSIVTGD